MGEHKQSLVRRSRGFSALMRWVAGGFVLAGGAGIFAGCSDAQGSSGPAGTAGAAGAAGATGAAGSAALLLHRVNPSRVSKLDLLFMVDNSISMADKQAILGEAVPTLLERLTRPACVDAAGNPSGGRWDGKACPGGKSAPEFTPVTDLHVGVISSSLGVRAGAQCARTADPSGAYPTGYKNPTTDDAAELVGAATYCRSAGGDAAFCAKRLAIQPKTVNGLGFLAWDSTGQPHQIWSKGAQVPATNAESDAAAFSATFRELVVATGEDGCGYEASLESIYRFLIEPDPPQQTPDPATAATDSPAYLDVKPQQLQLNGALLAQREAFLRPDSLLAVVALTDENDCSLNEFGVQGNANGQLLTYTSRAGTGLPRATSVCDQKPNDPCCYSCGVSAPPAGCTPDPVCENKSYTTVEDALNTRCFNQKRRFGIDLLHNVKRYVDGFTLPTVEGFMRDAAGAVKKTEAGQALFTSVANPLFSGRGLAPPRATSSVYFAGIVGVPWQDLATPDSLTGAGLRYLTAAQLRDKSFYTANAAALPAGKDMVALEGRSPWDLILGDDTGERIENPIDPFMLESVAPRSGQHPLTGAPLVPPPANGLPLVGKPNDINGHEVNRAAELTSNSDLQFVCTFPFPPSKAPTPCTADNARSCECTEPLVGNPLCLKEDGTYGRTQFRAKAYPQTRILSVLKQLRDNAIVGSICPKSVDSAQSDSSAYGYNAVMSAVVDRLKSGLAYSCTPIALDLRPDGKGTNAPRCEPIQATFDDAAADCAVPGKAPLDPVKDRSLIDSVKAQLRGRLCDVSGTSGASCEELKLCRVLPVGAQPDGSFDIQNAGYQACLTEQVAPSSLAGFCYIDPATGAGDPSNPLVSSCPDSARRLVRFLPENGFVANSAVFIACNDGAR